MQKIWAMQLQDYLNMVIILTVQVNLLFNKNKSLQSAQQFETSITK